MNQIASVLPFIIPNRRFNILCSFFIPRIFNVVKKKNWPNSSYPIIISGHVPSVKSFANVSSKASRSSFCFSLIGPSTRHLPVTLRFENFISEWRNQQHHASEGTQSSSTRRWEYFFKNTFWAENFINRIPNPLLFETNRACNYFIVVRFFKLDRLPQRRPCIRLLGCVVVPLLLIGLDSQ